MKIIHLILALSLAFSGASFASADSDPDQVVEKQSKSRTKTAKEKFSKPVKVVLGLAAISLAIYVSYESFCGLNAQLPRGLQQVMINDDEAESGRVLTRQVLTLFKDRLNQQRQVVLNDPHDREQVNDLRQMEGRLTGVQQHHDQTLQRIQSENDRFHPYRFRPYMFEELRKSFWAWRE